MRFLKALINRLERRLSVYLLFFPPKSSRNFNARKIDILHSIFFSLICIDFFAVFAYNAVENGNFKLCSSIIIIIRFCFNTQIQQKSEKIRYDHTGKRKIFSYDMIGEFHSCGPWLHPKRNITSTELVLVLQGTVYIAEEARQYAVNANQLIVLEPHREHYGYKTVSEPVSFYWFHFYTDLELPLKTYAGNDIYEIKRLLKRLLHISNSSDCAPYAADAAGLLIYHELKRLSLKESLPNQALAVQIGEYIRNNIKNGITVRDIARSLGYNPDYLGKYFKKYSGTGLKEYLSAQRLKLAKDLLLTTDMSVKQIARELGYTEENVFIKFFTYHEAITPAVFRSKSSKIHINNK